MAELEIVVTPRAARDGIGEVRDGVLRVRVARPPADGEANRAVVRVVAAALNVPPSTVTIASGERARRKRLVLTTLDDRELRRRVAAIGRD